MSNIFVPQTLYKNLQEKKKNFEKLLGYLSFQNLSVNVVKELFKEYLYLILLAKVGKCKRPTGSTKVPALFEFL